MTGVRRASIAARALRSVLFSLLPIIILDSLLFIFPMVVMGAVSFLEVNEFRLTPHFTLTNYAFVFSNWLYSRLLIKTAVIALLVTALCLLLGYPFAYFLVRQPRRWQRTLLVMVILPFWTSYLLRAYAWMTILGEHGLINRGLLLSGLIHEPIRFLLYNNFSVILVSLYLYVPFSTLTLYTTLERLDLSLVTAAMDLGATPAQTFRHVVLPLTLPGIFASFIFVFIPMLGEYITPTLVGGAGGMLIVNIVVSEFRGLRFGVGSALVFLITLFVLIVLLILRRVANLERVFGT